MIDSLRLCPRHQLMVCIEQTAGSSSNRPERSEGRQQCFAVAAVLFSIRAELGDASDLFNLDCPCSGQRFREFTGDKLNLSADLAVVEVRLCVVSTIARREHQYSLHSNWILAVGTGVLDS